LTRYVLRRLAFAALLVVAVSSGSLILARLSPGDCVTRAGQSSGETERLRARYGLDKSIGAQYVDWLGRIALGDFGDSCLYDRPVRELVPERAANTAILAATALALATFVGIPLGVVSGSRRRGPLGAAIRSVSILFVSLPPILTSLFLVFICARTKWLPIAGMRSASVVRGDEFADLLRHLIVPASALALPLAAMFERLQSQAMSEAMAEPFVVATAARGVPRARIVWRDALRVSLGPVTSLYGLVVGTLLSGSFIVEVVTAWPGLGSLMLNALRGRDVYLVAACAGAGAFFLACGTLLSDLALGAVDPRAAQ